MVRERLSETARKELESLTDTERRILMDEMSTDLPSDLDPVVREFIETIQKRPLLDPEADVVEMIRAGRRD